MTVTINIPPVIDSVAPPAGDLAGVNTMATMVLRNASRITGLAIEAKDLAESKWYWTGSASDAYGAHALRFSTQHETLGETLKRVGQGIDHFAEQLREAQSAHKDLISQVSSYHAHRDDLIRKVHSTVEASESEIADLQDRARRLSGTHSMLVADITTFLEHNAANEEALVLLFQRTDTVTEASAKDAGIDPAAVIAITNKPSPKDGPEAMARWWNGLSPETQEALITAYPDQLGSADGLPAGVRDDANRILLSRDLAELTEREADGMLTSEEKKRLENARAADTALAYADKYVVPGTTDVPGGSLWLYDPAAFGGEGRVAVGIGDLDTAKDVAIQTPGINTAMTDVLGGTKEATSLYESARFNGDGSSVATMFWLGYDTPALNNMDPADWGAVFTKDRAADGGERLASAVDGLRASRSDNPAHMTAIGHSYGSTVTSFAATDNHLAVDDVVLLGSPGTGPAHTAADFSVGADHVFDGRNSRDVVAFLGDEGWLRKGQLGLGLGIDPSSTDFGATRFEAESTTRGQSINPFADHVKYYDRNSESLYNMGRIVDGQSGSINSAQQSYDPWYSDPIDPEWKDKPTSGVPGRSLTGNDER